MKKIVLILALTLMCASLSAQTSLQQAVAAGNKVYVEIVNDQDHPLPADEVADVIKYSVMAGEWQSVTSKEDADFILSIVGKKKMVFNSPRTWLTPSVLDKAGNVLWQGDVYKADATMGNGYRATNTAIKKMLKKGFGNNLFKKAGREVK